MRWGWFAAHLLIAVACIGLAVMVALANDDTVASTAVDPDGFDAERSAQQERRADLDDATSNPLGFYLLMAGAGLALGIALTAPFVDQGFDSRYRRGQ